MIPKSHFHPDKGCSFLSRPRQQSNPPAFRLESENLKISVLFVRARVSSHALSLNGIPEVWFGQKHLSNLHLVRSVSVCLAFVRSIGHRATALFAK